MERAEHLAAVEIPMLFVQGTRDALADPNLLSAALADRGQLWPVEQADHSFHVPARSGRTDGEAMEKVLDAIAGWIVDLAI